MPLRYTNYKCIMTPLNLTSLETPKLHSSQFQHQQLFICLSSFLPLRMIVKVMSVPILFHEIFKGCVNI